MKRVLASLLDQLLYVMGALAAALLTRYLLDIAKPREDYRVLTKFMGDVTQMFDLVDPLEDANKARLMHLRRRYFDGLLASDTIPLAITGPDGEHAGMYTIHDIVRDVETTESRPENGSE